MFAVNKYCNFLVIKLLLLRFEGHRNDFIAAKKPR